MRARTSLLLRQLIHLRRRKRARVSAAQRRQRAAAPATRKPYAESRAPPLRLRAARTAGEETEESENSLSSVLKLRARFVLPPPRVSGRQTTRAPKTTRAPALLRLGGPQEAFEALEHVAVRAAVVQIGRLKVINLLLNLTQLVFQPSLALRQRL